MIFQTFACRSQSKLGGRFWHQLSSREVSLLNIDNLLHTVKCQPELLRPKDGQERLMIMSVLQSIKHHLSIVDSTAENNAVLDDLMIKMEKNIGRFSSESSGPLSVRDFGSFKLSSSTHPHLPRQPSSAFEESVNRVIVSMNLSNPRNQRQLVEHILLESVFSYSALSSNETALKRSNPGSILSSDTARKLLANSMVGVHADYKFQTIKDPAVSDIPDNLVISYLSTPHFTFKSSAGGGYAASGRAVRPNVDSSAYGSRAACCVFMHDNLSGVNYKSILNGLLEPMNKLLACQSFVGDVESPVKSLVRPVNVVLTDGFRWHFSRLYPNSIMKDMTTSPSSNDEIKIKYESSDVAMLKYAYEAQENVIAEFNQDISNFENRTSDLNVDEPGYIWQDGLLNIAGNDIELIIGVLEWFIRGYNLPVIDAGGPNLQ